MGGRMSSLAEMKNGFSSDRSFFSRIVHIFLGVIATAVVANLTNQMWTWLLVGVLMLTALVWPYLMLCEASAFDGAVRATQLAAACAGVALVARFVEPSIGWLALAAVGGLLVAIGFDFVLARQHNPMFKTISAESAYQWVQLYGVLAGVVGTAAFAPSPSYAWQAAATLIVIIAAGEVWDHLARGDIHEYDERGAFGKDKIVYVVQLAVLAAVAAWAAQQFPLLWVWLAVPVVVHVLRTADIAGYFFLDVEHLGRLLPEPGWRGR